MRNALLLFLAVFFLACNSSDKHKKTGGKIFSIADNQEGEDEITCWGIGGIELDNDLTSLEEKAGKENVSMDSLFLEGDFDGFVTTLWKGSDREIVVHWKENQAPYTNIEFLEISRPSSPYHFVNGIKIGTSLNDIVKLNGDTPVSLYGFGWDYGGTFVDFNKGKLAGEIPCFGGVFALPDSLHTEDVKTVMGDMKISSADPVFKKYQASLEKIRVRNL
ncbi:hypothetical protein [Pararcticibacter amylolyticus]|uniref:Uncharacterized protein n=1 Tax=Pararcticibacter amylolyticus TaxID=2173175 RepID=A0A2U2PFL9_9SPHI|nr:hypothetical protein [Pararcticibacter amylolyticus]PWG80173.1 hypothetical protein DDR33_13330 [Pararcticibacter amylolyticus]